MNKFFQYLGGAALKVAYYTKKVLENETVKKFLYEAAQKAITGYLKSKLDKHSDKIDISGKLKF